MVAIYTTVQREIHVHRALSVREACKRLIKRHGRLVFEDAATGDRVTAISGDDGESLRNYFKQAERALKHPGKYPVLAARAAILERTSPGTAQAMELHAQRHQEWCA
jgi:hypothetical protein